jgi:phospholipase C
MSNRSGRVGRARAVVGIFALALAAGCGGGGGSGGGAAAPRSTGGGITLTTPTAMPIDHVFIIFKENHTFDNYFASYPGANGALAGLNSSGQTVPLHYVQSDPWYTASNDWDPAHIGWDNGKMDGFDHLGGFPPQVGPDAPYMTYAPDRSGAMAMIPYYWDLAGNGVLCDNYFTSVLGPSDPNHLMITAAWSGGVISNPGILNGEYDVIDPLTGVRHSRPPGSFTAAEIPTALPVELEKAGLTWAAWCEKYTGSLASLVGDLSSVHTFYDIDVINALPDIATRIVSAPCDMSKSIASYLASGPVGNVTWIKPSDIYSEHPVWGFTAEGAEWTHRVIEAIGASPYWDHCAIFVTWDDWGGLYDHVPPPQVDAYGLGFRTPCLIASPYARRGYVDHTQYEHCSVLRFCEKAFVLPTMSTRDAAADDMMGAFDFKQAPRPFSEFHVP